MGEAFGISRHLRKLYPLQSILTLAKIMYIFAIAKENGVNLSFDSSTWSFLIEGAEANVYIENLDIFVFLICILICMSLKSKCGKSLLPEGLMNVSKN